MTRTVHLFEFGHEGHRLLFVRWLLDSPPDGWRYIWHTTRTASNSPAIIDLLAHPPQRLAIAVVPGDPFAITPSDPVGLVVHQWRKARLIRRQLRGAAHDDVVFIPYIDDVSLALGLIPSSLRGLATVALGMRLTMHLPKARRVGGRIRALLLRRLLGQPNLIHLLTNQADLVAHVASSPQPAWRKLAFYPDPAPSPAADRGTRPAHDGKSVPSFDILCYGHLTMRKGIARLLELAAADTLPEPVRFVLAGRQSPEVAATVAAWRTRHPDRLDRLLTLDRFITADEEECLLGECAMVWLAYRDHLFMSGVLVQAGIHGKPVIGNERGLLGWYIREHKLGLLDREGAASELALELADLMGHPGTLQAAGHRGRTLFASHTIEHFRGRIQATIRVALARSGRMLNRRRWERNRNPGWRRREGRS